MKFWQKAFLILLAVFVVTFNMSMVIVLHFTYQEELTSAREKAVGEAYFITSSLTSDFQNLESIENISIDSKRSAFKVYSSYYKQRKVLLGLYKEERLIESSLPESIEPEEIQGIKDSSLEKDIQKVWTWSGQDEKYMMVASRLLAPYEDYKLVYAYEMSSLEHSSNRLMQMAIGLVIGMTLLLGVILFIVLGKLTKPLSQLQKCTAEIATGSYGQTIPIKGYDEIADLGKQFNEMSLKIYEQMGSLQEENQKKQRLIDNMAHEFRTPLTSISGYAQYLMMAALEEEEKIESLGYILSEAQRLQKLSQMILKMADLREEEHLEIEPIDTKLLIQYLKGLFDRQDYYESIELTATTEVEFILGNKTMIESLLINLIENAMRACHEKGEVMLSFVNHQGKVHIRVEDNGIGMSLEEIEKIQEPFYRIDKARSRKMGGVGLGINFCKQIVALHDANLYYTSDLGKGTTVIVEGLRTL